jgi:hypothetical protein
MDHSQFDILCSLCMMEFHSLYQRHKEAFGLPHPERWILWNRPVFGLRDRPTSFLPTSVGPPEWYYLLENSQHTGLSMRKPWMHVRFVVDKVALGQEFYPSTSVFICQQFHYCSTLTIISILLLSGQRGVAWETPNKHCASGYRGAPDRYTYTLSVTASWEILATTEPTSKK